MLEQAGIAHPEWVVEMNKQGCIHIKAKPQVMV